MVQETAGISNSGLKENAATDVTSLSKTQVYEALYAVNAGIQRCLNALTLLEATRLPFRGLEAHKLMAEELRAGINHTVLIIMEQIEARDWAAHEKERLSCVQQA